MELAKTTPTTRRAVLRTSAWSVPAVLAASTAPVYADSQPAGRRTAPTRRTATPEPTLDVEITDRIVATLVIAPTGTTIEAGSQVEFTIPASYYRDHQGDPTEPLLEFLAPDWGATPPRTRRNGQRVTTVVTGTTTETTTITFLMVYDDRYSFDDTSAPVTARIDLADGTQHTQTLRPQLLPAPRTRTP